LENELVAFFAVLTKQRLDVLDGGRLERLEAVALVDALDDAEDVLAPADVLREEVAHAARRLSALPHSPKPPYAPSQPRQRQPLLLLILPLLVGVRDLARLVRLEEQHLR